jgi:hypothetical protein
VVPIAVHELIDVVPQLGPLNASINVLADVRLLPPAAISATSIFTEVQPEGVVNVYQTSYFVPAHEPAIPELVALYNVLDVVTQLLLGVSEMGAEQSSDCCANEIFENKITAINAVVVRAVSGSMVFQGF